jgi:hypothetical protein
MPKITQRMLTLQLRELEQDGIVHREVYQRIERQLSFNCYSTLWPDYGNHSPINKTLYSRYIFSQSKLFIAQYVSITH